MRTQVVLSLVFAHLMLAYVARARRTTFESGWWRGTVLRRAVAASLALQALVVLVPTLGAPLALTTLPPVGWAMATAVGILTPVLCDAIRPSFEDDHDRPGTTTTGTRSDRWGRRTPEGVHNAGRPAASDVTFGPSSRSGPAERIGPR